MQESTGPIGSEGSAWVCTGRYSSNSCKGNKTYSYRMALPRLKIIYIWNVIKVKGH